MPLLRRTFGVGWWILWAGLLSSAVAQAVGFVSLETTGFLRESSSQSDSSTWLRLGPKLRGENQLIEAELDLEASAYLTSAAMPGSGGAKLVASSLTIESRDTFIATAPGLLGAHSLTLGRRHMEWSRADEDWKLGLWSPRNLWDPLRAETLGLTGLFYRFSSGRWKFDAFVSPVSIPERGAPIIEENGELRSPSRDFTTPYGGAIVMNQLVDIRYRLERPPLRELLLQPGAAIRIGYSSGQGGAFASMAAGQLPISSLDVIAQASLAPGSQYIDAKLRPRVRTHRIATAEIGSRSRSFEVWASGTVERPLDADVVAGDWMSDELGSAWMVSGGVKVSPLRQLTLTASPLWIQETRPARADSELSLDLPSRFSYTQAFRLGVNTQLGPHWSVETLWIRDFASRGHQASGAIGYGRASSENGHWKAKIGTDLFWGDFSDSGVGRYVGHDRVWGKVSYAF